MSVYNRLVLTSFSQMLQLAYNIDRYFVGEGHFHKWCCCKSGPVAVSVVHTQASMHSERVPSRHFERSSLVSFMRGLTFKCLSAVSVASFVFVAQPATENLLFQKCKLFCKLVYLHFLQSYVLPVQSLKIIFQDFS